MVWAAGGWWIFRHRFELLSSLSRAFVSLPARGESNPQEAAGYIEKSRQKADGIRLDLMEKACSRFPLRYKGDLDFYRPHWLERYHEWNLQSSEEREPEPSDIVEPDQYWKDHKSAVVDALRMAVNASMFAFDIPAGTKEGWPAVHVPDEIARLARAACLEPVALFARGDYIEFREAKAEQEIRKDIPDFELKYTFEQDRRLFLLERLKNDERYRAALREYLGGSIPISKSACRGRDYRLACLAPQEALEVLQKIIYTAPSAALGNLYVQLGSLHLLLGGKEHAQLAADFYSGGTQDPAVQRDARAGLIRSFLALGDVERALEQLSQTSLLYKDRGRTDGEFRDLARSVLIKAGRFREADCFTDLAELPSGERDHCRDFQL